MSGAFISFEGLDGCGKSTQLARLVERLGAQGIDPVVVREPGGTALGEQVRELLLDVGTGAIDPRAEALLYAASRAELVSRTIEPALAAGRVVIADRYVDSSLAYQGAGRELGLDRVLRANELATSGRLPDLTVLLQVAPQVAAERRAAAAGAGAPDRIERAGDAFFERVAAAYVEIAERWPERVRVVDGSGAPEDVARRIDALVEPLLVGARTAQEVASR